MGGLYKLLTKAKLASNIRDEVVLLRNTLAGGSLASLSLTDGDCCLETKFYGQCL